MKEFCNSCGEEIENPVCYGYWALCESCYEDVKEELIEEHGRDFIALEGKRSSELWHWLTGAQGEAAAGKAGMAEFEAWEREDPRGAKEALLDYIDGCKEDWLGYLKSI